MLLIVGAYHSRVLLVLTNHGKRCLLLRLHALHETRGHRIARISVLPIEPNLAERGRISAINLDDYQLDPLTPLPSPSSPFSMAAYQWMTAKTDPTQREEALTVYGMETDACLEELEAFMTLWDVKPRAEESSLEALSVEELITQLRQLSEGCGVAMELEAESGQGIDTQMLNQLIATRVVEALAAAAEFCSVMHENFHGTEGAVGLTRWFEKLESQFGISNVAEGDRVKFASSTLLDGALTWWNVYVRSVTLDTAHATPWSNFKAMFIQKYCPRNEIKQMENEL
ncbi:hypothetical protein Tco_1285864 [Tanacetum coccineum]